MKKNLNLIVITILVLTIFSGCNSKPFNGSNAVKNISNTNVSSSNTAVVINSANTANSANITSSANVTGNTKSSTSSAAPQGTSKLNVADFNKLQKDMTYPEVAKILGSEGEIFSENDYAGAKMMMYKWSEPSGAFIKVIFQNGKLLDKVQTGLR